MDKQVKIPRFSSNDDENLVVSDCKKLKFSVLKPENELCSISIKRMDLNCVSAATEPPTTIKIVATKKETHESTCLLPCQTANDNSKIAHRDETYPEIPAFSSSQITKTMTVPLKNLENLIDNNDMPVNAAERNKKKKFSLMDVINFSPESSTNEKIENVDKNILNRNENSIIETDFETMAQELDPRKKSSDVDETSYKHLTLNSFKQSSNNQCEIISVADNVMSEKANEISTLVTKKHDIRNPARCIVVDGWIEENYNERGVYSKYSCTY